MTLRLGGDGAITGCTSLEEPTISISGLTMTTPIEAVSGTAAAPSYTFSGDTDNGLYYAGTNSIGVSTAGTSAIIIDSSGRLLVATSTSMQDASTLQVSRENGNAVLTLGRDDSSVSSGNGIGAIDFHGNAGGTYQQCARILAIAEDTHALADKATGLAFYTNIGASNATEHLRIDSSGRLLVGTTNGSNNTRLNQNLAVVGTGGDYGGASITQYAGADNNNSPIFDFNRSRGTTDGSYTKVVSGDRLGAIIFRGSDGSGFEDAAMIEARADAEFNTSSDASDSPGRLAFYTTPDGSSVVQERMRITNSGNVGIGTTSPNHILTLNTTSGACFMETAGAGYTAGTNSVYYGQDTAGEGYFWNRGDNHLLIGTNNTERMRIDSSGRLLVGTTSARANFYNSTNTANILLEGLDSTSSTIAAVSNKINTDPNNEPTFVLGRSGTNALGSTTIVADDNAVGRVSFQGTDGSDFVELAYVRGLVDGTPGANDMPGRLVFATTADGASSPTERMRIDSSGRLLVGTTNTTPAANNVSGAAISANSYLSISRSGDLAIEVNRMANDGKLMRFLQAGTEEGNISVNGTTVSYNGGHLSRWSQLASGAARIEILRGSVLSNLNEMCEWGDEDNEQLNRMKVSDVEGDRNVSGVFQAWDDDDDTYTNDFYCAMTGDFIIRIAQGTTVARGDLLMSAGDGTAKPQTDDIVRSKTVAKVTSTVVSETYSDGSYCVPCVLMAC